MKSIALVLVLLPLIYACSGKDSNSSSGSAGGTGGSQSNNEKPKPPVPANRKLKLQTADFLDVEGFVSEDGSTVYLNPVEDKLTLKIEPGMYSAGISFIIDQETHSIRKGCEVQAEELRLNRKALAGDEGSTGLSPETARMLLEGQRRELSMEAGYFNAHLEIRDVAKELRDVAIGTAHAVGFADVRDVAMVPLKDVRIEPNQISLAEFIEGADAFQRSYVRLITGTPASQRLVNGELCEILNGRAAALFNPRGGLNRELEIVISDGPAANEVQ